MQYALYIQPYEKLTKTPKNIQNMGKIKMKNMKIWEKIYIEK
jgi:hypothetical protein